MSQEKKLTLYIIKILYKINLKHDNHSTFYFLYFCGYNRMYVARRSHSLFWMEEAIQVFAENKTNMKKIGGGEKCKLHSETRAKSLKEESECRRWHSPESCTLNIFM